MGILHFALDRLVFLICPSILSACWGLRPLRWGRVCFSYLSLHPVCLLCRQSLGPVCRSLLACLLACLRLPLTASVCCPASPMTICQLAVAVHVFDKDVTSERLPGRSNRNLYPIACSVRPTGISRSSHSLSSHSCWSFPRPFSHSHLSQQRA